MVHHQQASQPTSPSCGQQQRRLSLAPPAGALPPLFYYDYGIDSTSTFHIQPPPPQPPQRAVTAVDLRNDQRRREQQRERLLAVLDEALRLIQDEQDEDEDMFSP